ncbi:MAG: tRNA (adenosine(37)-N6)-threonylcarbamoyltransferase complex dimerization subunit type 1 TsaB [Gemmatimonadota bacterium]|nr:MAG: tRNA (adenosine(37)-N6)-threonylcarbamoyltransferase complex dimerization subunit type 1 TsaB [Gemmatimonadota bacterium]
MIVLGIETATLIEGVAVVDGDRVVAEHRSHVGSTHAEHLVPTILQTLGAAGFGMKEVDGIAISIGPGSFTGLRIGLSAVKGLSLARGIPVVAVPTLDGLAYHVPFCRYSVCPILDAKRHEVYTALYRTSEGVPERLTEPRAINPEDLVTEISEPTIFLGDGVPVYARLIREHLGSKAHFAPNHVGLPSGSAIALLGHTLLIEGKTVDIQSVQPFYIRKSDAELKAIRGA